jgi:hypothetical protein
MDDSGGFKPMTEFEMLEGYLYGLGIDTSKPGFYDSPAFQTQAQSNLYFAETYARFVKLRPITEAYEARVKMIVPRLCQLIVDVFKADRWEGGCLEASWMMSRMLDRLGIWNYTPIGSVTFEVEHKGLCCGFYRHDFKDFPEAILGHAWVVAPPFKLVDATVSLQRLGDDPIREYLPVCVSALEVTPLKLEVSDIISFRMRESFLSWEGSLDEALHLRLDRRLGHFAETFPPSRIDHGALMIRYVPLEINLCDLPLEEINADAHLGRPAKVIWQDIILPAFA